MALGELAHKIQHVKLKPYRLEPINEESWANIPKVFRKGRYKRKYKVMPYTMSIVHTSQIATPYDLAKFMCEHYGFGTWVICFYDKFKKNKNFKQYFPCLWKDCKFFDSCKIKERKRANPVKYKACKMNPKHRPNWSSRAWVEITQKQNIDPNNPDDDFIFSLNTKKNQMRKFWFWQSKKHRKKIDREDVYF